MRYTAPLHKAIAVVWYGQFMWASAADMDKNVGLEQEMDRETLEIMNWEDEVDSASPTKGDSVEQEMDRETEAVMKEQVADST